MQSRNRQAQQALAWISHHPRQMQDIIASSEPTVTGLLMQAANRLADQTVRALGRQGVELSSSIAAVWACGRIAGMLDSLQSQCAAICTANGYDPQLVEQTLTSQQQN